MAESWFHGAQDIGLTQHFCQICLWIAADQIQVEIFLEHFHHTRCQELRRFGADIHVLHTQTEQPQQDGYRFLFKPGEHDAQRQIVYRDSEGFRQGQGNFNRRTGVVALAQVDIAWDFGAFDGAMVNIVKPELATRCG